MKRQDWEKLVKEDDGKLLEKMSSWQTELTKMRHEKVVGRAANPSRIARLADDIARIKTLLRERELANQE